MDRTLKYIISIGLVSLAVCAIFDFLTKGSVNWTIIFYFTLLFMVSLWIIRYAIKDYIEEDTPLYYAVRSINELKEKVDELTEKVNELEKEKLHGKNK